MQCRRCRWLQAETNAVAARVVTDRHTHTQTNKASTVTLAAHARRGLIMSVPTIGCMGSLCLVPEKNTLYIVKLPSLPPNLTEKSLQRVARSVSTLHSLCKQFDCESNVPVITSSHSTKADSVDTQKVVLAVLEYPEEDTTCIGQ